MIHSQRPLDNIHEVQDMTGRTRKVQHSSRAKNATVAAAGPSAVASGHELRRQAEKILRQKKVLQPETLEALSLEEIRTAFHELQVHQIELEMQNEELHRTQVELDLARARYFDLYDLAPIGYCALNDKGLIKEANLTASSLLGVARSALVRQPISRFIVKEDQDRYYLLIHQLVDTDDAPQEGATPTSPEASPEPHVTELRMQKSDGTVFWVSLKATAVPADRNSFEFRLVVNDISERKQAEGRQIELEVQTRQIEKAESLQRMAGAIAHLFNNQLSVILGNLEMTISDTQGDALPHQYLVNAMRAVSRSSEVSSLLLTYLGQSTSRLEPLDLSVFCHDNLPVIKEDGLPATIALETDFLSPGPVVLANANQVQQILTNLITNGREAIGDTTGRISVVTRTVPTADIPKVHIAPTDWQTAAETFACLEVTDSGCGMTEEEMERIFDPFFSTKFTGRGLGLAVVTGLAKAWNGMIAVSSTVGQGSTLQVFLPLVTDMVPRQPEVAAGPCDLGSSWTVLLVDDDAIVRDITGALLKHLGLTVLEASGGNEAVAVLEKDPGRIDCVLTDLCMPGMDGWDTLAALRRIRPGLPAILSSGYDEAQAIDGEYVEQPHAFLHKPYSMEVLRAVICRVMSGAVPKVV
ncbi:response regulator [Desulfoprunum benzoelyticum]|uniref:histidine kinase n=1 Tax=Desulfoprunum benzoelyticum TaxID=1506996 RepID=A0A840UW12_9BACT|nr:ATP-binding protein [Desulfoprunum benzoelyticum]MBB5349026.1 PAS domain S-box-containing protein [Desulfoprunum benzoelyticum]MBM9530519.1 response regulator [Desulfoprunum benzoelyticum]